jgi:hypothetical protein
MQGIYTYIPETNHDPREYTVAAILLLLFMVPISVVPALGALHFYVGTLLLLPSSSSSSSWTIKKGIDEKVQLLPGHLSATELQKITLRSTAHINRKMLGVNHFDLLLRSGLTSRPPPGN